MPGVLVARAKSAVVELRADCEDQAVAGKRDGTAELVIALIAVDVGAKLIPRFRAVVVTEHLDDGMR